MKQGSIGVTTENIFPVIKKFLYSDHEIFLRELVANAVDATQKIKALADSGEFKGELGDLTIRIEADSEAKTLKIIDNGLGITEEEVNKYINQIAFSSAGEFLEKYKDQLSSIIGHFGLGFYSAFMVSKKVEIDTLSWNQRKSKSTPFHGKTAPRPFHGHAKAIRNTKWAKARGLQGVRQSPCTSTMKRQSLHSAAKSNSCLKNTASSCL